MKHDSNVMEAEDADSCQHKLDRPARLVCELLSLDPGIAGSLVCKVLGSGVQGLSLVFITPENWSGGLKKVTTGIRARLE